MAKAELKTKNTKASVEAFLGTIKQPQEREDSLAILDIMKKVTKEQPEMWGGSIVGFGHILLTYESGRELDWMKIGFSPRKAALTLYGLIGSIESEALIAKLGKCKTSKGCLYINKLTDVDSTVLQKLIQTGWTRKNPKVA